MEQTVLDEHGYYFEELEVGMEASYKRVVQRMDIVNFAELSGDINPQHLNEEFACGTIFKECIAHGMLTSSYLSAVFGTMLPGPGCIYVSQTLNFKAPVVCGDEVTATVVIRELIPDKKTGCVRL